MPTAEDNYNLGLIAFQNGHVDEAIEYYCRAIDLDATKPEYFYHRSKAFQVQGDSVASMEDSMEHMILSKGGTPSTGADVYARKGAVLHSLEMFQESIEVYKDGLKEFPGNPCLEDGLVEAVNELIELRTGLGPEEMVPPRQCSSDDDPDDLHDHDDDDDYTSLDRYFLKHVVQTDLDMRHLFTLLNHFCETTPRPTRPGGAEPTPRSPELQRVCAYVTRVNQRKRKAAELHKEIGNTLYKAQQYEAALVAYDQAIVVDPSNMLYYTNKAAVYLMQKEFDECIWECEKALQVGKQWFATPQDMSKALVRMAKAYQNVGNWRKAMEMCERSLRDYPDDETTQRLLLSLQQEQEHKIGRKREDRKSTIFGPCLKFAARPPTRVGSRISAPTGSNCCEVTGK